MCLILLPCSAPHPDLHSFPTRRSSDLGHGGRRDAVIRTGAEVDTLPDVVRDRARAHEVTVDRFVGLADRKSTRLNSSHRCISYAVFCLKKKKQRYRASISRTA